MQDLRTKSAEEIDRKLLDVDGWPQLAPEDLWELLNASLILYGIRQDPVVIPHLAKLYDNVVEITTAERRLQTFTIIEEQILQGITSVVALLPLAICDPDISVTSGAALSVIANSPLTKEAIRG